MEGKMIEVKETFDSNCKKFISYDLKVFKPGGNDIDIAYCYAPYSRRLLKASSLGQAIIDNLMKIKGIKLVILVDGLLSIEKGVAFNWDNIEPQVLYTLETLIQNPGAELLIENKEEEPRCIVEGFSFKKRYHLNREVFLGNLGFFPIIFGRTPPERLKELEPPIREVVKKLRDSGMVKIVFLKNYSIEISGKNLDCEWEDVETLLKAALKEFFNFSFEEFIVATE